MTTRILLLLGAVLVFGTVNWQVAGKERLRSNGQIVYLDLRPKDPRSLMQGDYMALNFALAGEIARNAVTDHDGPGVAVIKLDPHRVARFVRLDTSLPLDPDELRFRFRIRKGEIWLGTDAFFFQEGQEERYRNARYGAFRVAGDGEAMLVDAVVQPAM
jgi:uncharacterized membrane-anchored protein